MSAFAARQQLWGAAATKAASAVKKTTPEPAPEETARLRKSETPSARSVATRSSKRQPPEEPARVPSLAETKQTKGQDTEDAKGRLVYVDS
jgi:polynucleotide 5'-hydroxyl-kinase GRC3/NOL9